MGNRLNVELMNGDKVLCGCCWHERAFTDEALDVVECIVKTYDDIFNSSRVDLYIAIKIFELMGGGIIGIERQRIKDQCALFNEKMGGDAYIRPARSVYDGIISITEESIRETRQWEQARVKVDLAHRTFDFHVHYYTYQEEYIEFCDQVPGNIRWEDLPRIDAGPDIFNGIYFDHISMIRRLIEQCPNGFRIQTGDVIEWM